MKMYVRAAGALGERDSEGTREGQLEIQRDDVASRERVSWEPIRLERPIIPMTR